MAVFALPASEWRRTGLLEAAAAAEAAGGEAAGEPKDRVRCTLLAPRGMKQHRMERGFEYALASEDSLECQS